MDSSSAQVSAMPSLDLNGFDFASSEVTEALVRPLHGCGFMDAAKEPTPRWQDLPRVGPSRLPPWPAPGALAARTAKSLANGRRNRSIFSRVEPIQHKRPLALVIMPLMEPTQSPGPSASTSCADREREAKCGR
ncbi:hypothetical protein BQ8482_360132 [Mesorhizobium delmotii]|uniref:Uncharacterized protein n=1 Tax=Mesorhizobium delmotii TaxID=1631247 RepID=A0A2P9ARD5_9HYPH|nr:hypothetical protein BQ8482_360132 [Mesorhizobium delmotii]